MANKARKYSYAESLTTSTSAVTTDTTKATLTFTPDASSDYLYIWSCDVASTSISYDIRVSFNNNAGTALSATNVEPADTTDWITVSGIAFETFGTSPTSQSVTLKFSIENVAATASIRNAKIIAIKLTSADVYTENTADQTTTSSTYQTAATLTFTPATTGSYLILGSCESRSGSSVAAACSTQLLYNAVSYGQSDIIVNDVTNYFSGMMQANVGSLTNTSKTITMQWKNGNNSTTVYCRRARIVALRLDEFTSSSIAEASAESTTTSLTYTNKVSNPANTIAGLSYLVIGTAIAQGSTGSPTTLSSGYGISVNGTYITESLIESGTVGGYYGSSRFGSFTVATATSSLITANIDYYAETASVASGISQATVSVLLLDPTDLYWVGGSGTWDSSATTNWSLTSGGTGNVAAPKSGINVNFDSSSDSSAPFTVTINTGAVCNDLIASALDQTMTLSGSAAMSVYGSFSVPATNFTQSYTGTITFASDTSETITTNGKTFTAFTFNGENGNWTLQDSTTITGAATFTVGTINLSSYTFTCATFDSNNSNARTLNFGTGKIVITSSSTATVWTTSTVTGLTISGTPLIELTGGGATTKTVTLGALSESNSISVTLNTTAGTVALTGSVRNLILANNSFTLSNSARTIYGNFTINGTSPTLTAGAATTTFAATSGTKTITTNGKMLNFDLTFDGAGGIFSLGSSLTVGDGSTTTARVVTLTAGRIKLNSYTFTVNGQFKSNNTNTRGIDFDTGTLFFTPNASGGESSTSPGFDIRTTTGWTTTTSSTGWLEIGGSIANANKYIAVGTLTETDSINVKITISGGFINFITGTASWIKNLYLNQAGVGAYSNIGNVSSTIYGNVTYVSGDLSTGGTMTFAGTTGTQTITSGGYNFDFNITFSGTGTYQLQDNLNVGVATSRTVTLTAGTLDLNEYNLTIYGVLSSTNANARTIDFGAVSKIIFTLSSATTVVNTTTATNFSVLGDNPLFQLTGAGGTATFTFGSHTESGSVNVQLSSATTTTVVLTGSIRNLTIDNYDITLNNGVRTLYGNLTVSGVTPILVAGTSATTFAATSGTKTINLNGNNTNTLDFPITFNGSGGTWRLEHNLNLGIATSRTATLTAGTINLNNYTFTIYGVFSSSNTNTRSIAFGSSGKIVLNLAGTTATTIWNMANATNFTVSGTPLAEVTGSGTLVRTINSGSSNVAGESGVVSFSLLTSAGTITFGGGAEVKTLILNCSGTTVNLGTTTGLTFYGSLTNTASTLNTIGTSIFAATSGTNTIDTGGATFNDITINGVGGTFALANNLNLGVNNLTFTNGTFDASSYNVTAGGLQSDNTNTRTLNMGSGTWTLSNGGGTRNGGSQPWNINDGGTGLTLNKQNANIILSYNSTGATEFYGGGKTYNNVTFSGTSTGLCRIYGSNTFATLSIPNNRGKDLYFESGTTNTVASFDVTGENGDTMILASLTAGVQATLAYSGTTKQTVAYALIQDMVGYPAQTWYAGTTSTNNGNNKDIYFKTPEPFYKAGNGPGTWLQFLT